MPHIPYSRHIPIARNENTTDISVGNRRCGFKKAPRIPFSRAIAIALKNNGEIFFGNVIGGVVTNQLNPLPMDISLLFTENATKSIVGDIQNVATAKPLNPFSRKTHRLCLKEARHKSLLK